MDAHDFDEPTLVFDLDHAVGSYRTLAQSLAPAHIHYAVKANPEPQLVRRLVAAGCRFDAASRGEIALCLDAGADARHVSFGNTVKKVGDIAWARAHGIDLFAADATEELDKLAIHAPGARVYIRLLVEHSQADWPLSRKFGAPAEEILPLMRYARAHGLNPVGISFHVGSQTRRAEMWRPVLTEAAGVWHDARAEGFELEVLNIGGGFPAFYGDEVEAPMGYGTGVMDIVRAHFGDVPYIMAEPGRGLVAEAGAISAEVLLVSRKRPSDIARWVYLNIGKFSGLAETIDEAIRYQFDTTADGGETGPCILAGPSCDSADVLYEQRPIQMPTALRAGDRVRILNTGAYTTTYASVGFNGFPPLHVVCI
ncbi:type III PLP-dependent enzyme [Oceanibium sediminis]|uniref:type III PLP-dependent enzyme n=1 Tax=Oceanibium sediminis TaxID=2026339 RepID=UPI001E3E83E7|nr:type III PLP-dependent enzyme [Oceanibium sediminis]